MGITIYDFIEMMTDTYFRFSIWDYNSEEPLVDNKDIDVIYDNNYEYLNIESFDIYTTSNDNMVHICFNVSI